MNQNEKDFLKFVSLYGMVLGMMSLMFVIAFILAFLKIPKVWSNIILLFLSGLSLLLLYFRHKSLKLHIVPFLVIAAGSLIIFPFWSGIHEAKQRNIISGIEIEDAVHYQDADAFSFTNGRVIRGKGGTYTDADGMTYYAAPVIGEIAYDKSEPVVVYVCIKSEGSAVLATESWDYDYSGGIRINPAEVPGYLNAVNSIETTFGLSPHPHAVLLEWTNPLTQVVQLRSFIILAGIIIFLVITVYYLISSSSSIREMYISKKEQAFWNN